MNPEKKPSNGEQMAKPDKVKRAQLAGDTEALRAFGRAGAKQRMENEDAARFMDEHIATKRAAEEDFRRKQSGEDIISPQP